MDQGGSEVEATLHPSRVRPDAAVDRVADVDHVQHVRHALLHLDPVEAVEARLEREELAARLAVVERRVLKRDPDAQADLPGLGGDVVPEHERSPCRWQQQGAEHSDDGRLAGAIGAEEAVDLARTHFEVDAVHRHGVVESALDALCDHSGRHGRRPYRGPARNRAGSALDSVVRIRTGEMGDDAL